MERLEGTRHLDVFLYLCLLVGALRLSKVTLEIVFVDTGLVLLGWNSIWYQLSWCDGYWHLVVVAALHGIEPAHAITPHPSVRVACAE